MKKILIAALGLVVLTTLVSAAITPRADIYVKKVYLQPKYFQPGEDAELVIVAGNKGNADSVPCEVLVIYNNDKTTVDLDGIAVKKSEKLVVELTLSDAQEHSFYIKLDAKTANRESNKLNNRKEVTFKVKAKPTPTPAPAAAPVKEQEEEEPVPEDAALPEGEEEEQEKAASADTAAAEEGEAEIADKAAEEVADDAADEAEEGEEEEEAEEAEEEADEDEGEEEEAAEEEKE